MTQPGLLASCARQDGDNQKILTLSYVSYPYLKSHAVWALYLSHTENEIEKTGWGGVQASPPLTVMENHIGSSMYFHV